MKACIMVAVAALGLLIPGIGRTESGDAGGKPLLRAAIFVQNRAGAQLQGQVDPLNDHLTAYLTEKGFSIIDKNVVIARFREAAEKDETLRARLITAEEILLDGKSETNVEDAISGASALRIAQMIGADYMVMAAITSLGNEKRSFKGQNTIYATSNQVNIYNLKIALKVLEGNQGGTVYGDVVTASERVAVTENLAIETTDLLPKLVEAGSRKIADNISSRMEEIRNVKVKTIPVVEFGIASNVEGATVELDGAVIGSTPGRFTAAPGLHQLRITKEWLSSWERTVNIAPNQVLNVSLELSKEGLQRYATLERLKEELARGRQDTEMEMKERQAGVDIAKEQSEAEAYSKKQLAEGEKKKREESYDRIEGAPAPVTNIFK